jgi:hypothetical protein
MKLMNDLDSVDNFFYANYEIERPNGNILKFHTRLNCHKIAQDYLGPSWCPHFSVIHVDGVLPEDNVEGETGIEVRAAIILVYLFLYACGHNVDLKINTTGLVRTSFKFAGS